MRGGWVRVREEKDVKQRQRGGLYEGGMGIGEEE